MMERVYSSESMVVVAVMSQEEYQAHVSVQGKEEMQMTIPQRDVFSEEIRIFISNGKECIYTKLIYSRWRTCAGDILPKSGQESRRDQAVQRLRECRHWQAGIGRRIRDYDCDLRRFLRAVYFQRVAVCFQFKDHPDGKLKQRVHVFM